MRGEIACLESWALGALMALIGILLLACARTNAAMDFGLLFETTGITMVGLGALIFVVKFKSWISDFENAT